MVHLLILRHGKTERMSPSGSDFDRRLTRRGVDNATDMGKHIREHMKKPDLVLTSPSERTQGTAEHVMVQLGYIPCTSDERIYHADGERLWNVLADHAHEHKTVLLIGHNPGLIILMHMLLDEGGNTSLDTINHFPTCALAELGFNVQHIGDIKHQTGKLLSLVRPRELGLNN